MRRWPVLIVLILLTISGLFAAPVAAQSETSWCYLFDFTADAYASIISNPAGEQQATYVSGQGYYGGGSVFINLLIPANSYLNLAAGQYSPEAFAVSQALYDAANSEYLGYHSDVGWVVQDNYPEDARRFQMAVANGYIRKMFVAGIGTDPGYGAGEATVDIFGNPCGDAPPGGSLTKPLANDDIHPQWGMYDTPYLQMLDEDINAGNEPLNVAAYSDNVSASVAAVAAGTVVSVTPYSCSGCGVVIPSVITQSGAHFRFGVEETNMFIVIIRDAADTNITYESLVAYPVVQVGDAVAAGCILGETVQLKRYNPNFVESLFPSMPDLSGLSVPYSTELLAASVTFVLKKNTGVSERLYPQLVLEPSLDDCAAQNLSGCLNDNSDLRSLDAWTVAPNVTLLNGGGVTMGYRSSMYQSGIVIDEGEEYVFTVQARTKTSSGINDPAALTVVLGNDADGFQTQGFPLTTTWKNFTFAPTTGSLPTPLTIGLQNSGPTDIEIRYVCFASGVESIEHGSCYFQNHEFEADEARWTVFGDTTFTAGQAYVRHDGVFEQSVRLNANDDSSPHTYVVTAQMRLLANPSYTGQAGKSVTVNYRFPQTGSYTALGTIDSAAVAANGLNPFDGTVNLEYPYVLEDELVISANTTGLFSFQVQVTDAQNYLTGVRFDWVCIRPTTEDGSFPGQGGAGGYEPPFVPECAFVPVPLDNTIGAWTYYHWKNLERFFNCDLMVLLNEQFEMLNDFQTTIRLALRYWIVLAQYVGDWITSFFQWLNGHLSNIAIGQVTTIFNGEEQCNNLFCVLTGGLGIFGTLLEQLSTITNFVLSLLTQAANLLFSVLVSVLTLIVSMLTQILNLLLFGQRALTSIVAAYNTPAIPIPGIPTCTGDPRASGFCIFFWMVDNTVLSGPGELIIPLMVSIFSIHLLIWVALEIKRLVQRIGATA